MRELTAEETDLQAAQVCGSVSQVEGQVSRKPRHVAAHHGVQVLRKTRTRLPRPACPACPAALLLCCSAALLLCCSAALLLCCSAAIRTHENLFGSKGWKIERVHFRENGVVKNCCGRTRVREAVICCRGVSHAIFDTGRAETLRSHGRGFTASASGCFYTHPSCATSRSRRVWRFRFRRRAS